MIWTSKGKIALIGIIIISMSACAAVVVGGAAGATYSYVKGWYAVDYGVPFNKAYFTSIEALKQHDLTILENSKDINVGLIKAQGAKREIWIRVKRKKKGITKVSIRVGVIGDRQASRLIHDTIRDML